MASQPEVASLLQAEEAQSDVQPAARRAGDAARGLGDGAPESHGGVSLVFLFAMMCAAATVSAGHVHVSRKGVASIRGLQDEKMGTFGRGNCNVTQSCGVSGMQCYEQDASYAQCRAECIEGVPDPSHWNGNKWSCKELGPRTEGEPGCGKPGDDCSKSQCCADPGMQCYQKTEGWAMCKAACVADAPDMTDSNGDAWTCKELGERTPGAQAWIQDQCSVAGEDCSKTSCCKNAGEQCYADSGYWAECFPIGSCAKGSCKEVGYPTPDEGSMPKGAKLHKWALSKCGKLSEGCLESRCCLGMDVQCFEKNDNWAMCMQSCKPGKHKEDNNSQWSCNPLGPVTYGLARKGFPSLYCFQVYRIDGYEKALIQTNWDRRAGIFECDDYDLLTQDGSAKIGDVQSIEFPGAEIVMSIDGTAGNTFLFVNAWNAVIHSNKWNNHAFTCKVDPDAVFIPDRVRWHVERYVDENMYVVNCPQIHMMYGALEVYSFKAIQAWAARKDDCNAPNELGEDKYMTECMDTLGMYRVKDEAIMGDKLCGSFTDCGDQRNAAFHPFKDVGSFTECMDIAKGTGASEA